MLFGEMQGKGDKLSTFLMNLYILLNIFIKLLENNLFFRTILSDISANQRIEKRYF